MKQHRYWLVWIGLVLFFVVTACRQAAPPVVNSSGVGTSLASTARALAKQTEAANPFTATPSPTGTATPTPTPKISLYGTSLIPREDQTALFIDHKAGIQLIVPAGWMPIRVNEDEYYKAFTLDVVLQNPALSEHLTLIQDSNLEYQRLDAVDIRPDHIHNGIISNFNVIFQADDRRSLEKWEQAERKRKPPLADYRFIRATYPTLQDGTRVLVIEESWTASARKGTIYYRGVFFSIPTGTIVLDLYTNKDFKDTVLPEFEQVLNSLTLLTGE